MTQKARFFGSIICVAGAFQFLLAQQINISGTVNDAGGKGIAGAIVSLIAATTTRQGLRIRCALDPGPYPGGVKVSDAELAAVNLERHTFHGDWNYTLCPRSKA